MESVVSVFCKWLYLPDGGTVEIMLSAYAANRLKGDAVWLLLVGSSSGGKGEAIGPFENLPYTHKAAHVSEASLLLGTSKDSRSDDADWRSVERGRRVRRFDFQGFYEYVHIESG